MEKTLLIEGQKVKFKLDGSSPIRYMMLFQRDYFADIISLKNLIEIIQKVGTDEQIDTSKLNFTVIYNIIHLAAKSADKNFTSFEDWLSEFDSFPLLEVFMELQELVMANMQSTSSLTVKKK